jgi:hypothetical protein
MQVSRSFFMNFHSVESLHIGLLSGCEAILLISVDASHVADIFDFSIKKIRIRKMHTDIQPGRLEVTEKWATVGLPFAPPSGIRMC